MRVRPSPFYRTHGRHAHHCIAQPIAAPNQNSNWFQFFGRQTIWNENPAFVANQKKIRAGRFPTIVQPETILRRNLRLSFDQFICFGGDRFNGIAGFVDARSERHSPTPRGFGVNRSSEHRRAGAFCQERRQRRSRGELSKKRDPQTLVTRMLIAQDSNRTTATQNFDRFLKTFVAIKHFNAGEPPQRPDVFVDVAVFQWLINGAIAHIPD